MKSEITIIGDNLTKPEIDYKLTKFPCGEIQIQLKEPLGVSGDGILVFASIKDSDGIIALAQVKACLDLWHPKEVSLSLTYLPYARQDRICNKGECHSLKLFADMVNSMGFDQVILTDPHSIVAAPLFERVVSIPKKFFLDSLVDELSTVDTFVAPDAGASKEVQELCTVFGKEFIQGYKKRDLKTGELSGFGYYGDIKGKNLLVVDDLCDYGGTFVGLASELKEGKPNTVSLYVTHGCFNGGTGKLLRMYDKIYTTNSYNTELQSTDRLKVLPVFRRQHVEEC